MTGARSLELDLHNAGGDWAIYHFLVDPETSVETLSDALAVLWGIGRAMPEHEVISVFLDLKNRFKDANTPDRLNELIRGALPRRLSTPGHLWSRSPRAASLQEAVAEAGWPTLAELRGKVLGDAEAHGRHFHGVMG